MIANSRMPGEEENLVGDVADGVLNFRIVRAILFFTRPIAVSFVAALACLPAGAETEPRVAGRILDRVVCEGDPSQAYALYVPSNYNREGRWPVIFCFDASARGRLPVERLQQAAEKYGYVVAGSLTSRNGPWTANAAAIQAMERDVTAHFSIDSKRVYAAGVSGGARVAFAMALAGAAKGVIACSAGFPASDAGVPVKIPFVVFGTTGTEDFNYPEMKRLDEELEARGAAHRIVVFEGGHTWASADLLTDAVEWLELQAMRSGMKPKEDGVVQTFFKKRVAEMPLQPSLARWRALKSLAADFSELVDVGAFAQEAKALGSSRRVRSELKAESALAVREEELIRALSAMAEETGATKDKRARDLRVKADAAEDAPERQMVRRAIAAFVSITRESVPGLFASRRFDEAAGLLEMAAALRPVDVRTHWDLARAWALAGNKNAAFAALQQAVVSGLSDSAQIENDPAFVSLRGDVRFRQILATIAANAGDALELPVMRISAALASVEVRPFYLPNAGEEVPSLSFLRIETVSSGSPGARAGAQPGMEITAIEGRHVRGLTDQDLNEILDRPVKKEIALLVREPGQTLEREIRIPLKKPTAVPPAP